MLNLIERFMNSLTPDQVNNFAISKNVQLNSEELDFTYNFIKKNWRSIISNPTLLNLDRYQDKYSKDNFTKIKQVFLEYSQKYQNLI
ncbi:MAG: hypothetical protein J6B98_06745 [Bacilli bacterium]|nr:hypothetical protein [Bacilli bacterium]